MNLRRCHDGSFPPRRSKSYCRLVMVLGKIRHFNFRSADGGQLALQGLLLLNLLLELQNPLHEGFWTGGAAGHVDVHWDNLVDSLQDMVAMFPIRAPTGRTTPH